MIRARVAPLLLLVALLIPTSILLDEAWAAPTWTDETSFSQTSHGRGLDFSSDSQYLAVGDHTQQYVEIWNTTTWNRDRTLSHTGNVYPVSFSPDGKWLASGDYLGRVEIWNATTWSNHLRLSHGGQGKVYSLDFSEDGNWLAVGLETGRTQIWDVNTWTDEDILNNTNAVFGVEFTPDSQTLVTGSYQQIKVWSWGGSSWTESENLTWSSTLGTLDISPDGSLLVFDSGNTTRVLSTSDWSNVTTLNGTDWPPTFSSDGDWIGTTLEDNSIVGMWNTTNWTLMENLTHDTRVRDIAFSPNGSFLSSVSSSGTTKVWQTNVTTLPLDSDGDGINDPQDDCPTEWGNSTVDQWGCPDADGDGYSDSGDDFPNDPTEWVDSDSDGIGNNSDDCPTIWGNSTFGEVGCPDGDGDGWSDATDHCPVVWGNNTTFPGCPDGGGGPQDYDTDGDGYNDSVDDCDTEWGNSTIDRTACPDSDGDGYSDAGDAFPSDPGEWADSDGDGLGDNSDDCPLTWGNSTWPNRGCPDSDGDGVEDGFDLFPNDPTESNDTDSDGFGDNSDQCPIAPGIAPDGCPEDPGGNETNNTNNTNGTNNGTGNQTNNTDHDRDGDGYDNITDYCPDTWGNSTAYGVYGCPDSDGDTVDDTRDDCPLEPGDPEGDIGERGCPEKPGPDPNGTDTPNVTDNGSENASGDERAPALGFATWFVTGTVISALIIAVAVAVVKSQRGGDQVKRPKSNWGKSVPTPDLPNGKVLPDSHPTLVVEELDELDWGDSGSAPAPAPVERQSKPAPSHLHILESEATFEEQIETLKSRVTPIIDEANRPLLRELKELKSKVRNVFHDGEMGKRRHDRLMRDIDQLERGINTLLPLKI